jgi:polyphosphate kinase 2 (PPK2 family)
LIVPIVQKKLPPRRVAERMQHIKDFELMLSQEGTTIVKFLLHISRDEQWERLMSRLDEPHRNWKFSMNDLTERERWPLYVSAFKKIVSATSVEHAPWYVIPANSKWFRDLAISEVVRATMENMSLRWPKPSIEVEPARKALKKLR